MEQFACVTDTFCLASSSGKLFPSSQLHAFSLFEESYISWPSHTPTGEKENIRKVLS